MNRQPNEAQPWKQEGVSETTAKLAFARLGLGPEAVPTDATVLDFGCGNGRYMKVFARLLDSWRIHGVDVDDGAFQELGDAGFQCARLPEHGAALPFGDEIFDCVFSSNVIEHIPRAQYLGYLNEIFRVLKPGGVFAVGAPNYPVKRLFDLVSAWRYRRQPDKRRYYLHDDPTHVNFVGVRGVAADLQTAGFVDVELLATELPLQRYVARLRSEAMRRTFRVLGNKFFGNCRRPL